MLIPTLSTILATAFWGASFVLTKLALQEMQPTTFLFWRFLIATLSMLPSLTTHGGYLRQKALVQGVQLGLLQVGLMFLQTLGLQTLSPSLSAFLSGFFIVFVLFIKFITQGRLPGQVDVLSTLTCLAGLALLTHSHGLAWEIGIFYTLGGAFFVALHTYLLDIYIADTHVTALTFVQMLTLALFAGFMSLWPGNGIHLPVQIASWGAILFCGTFSSSIACWLQASAQKHLGAFKIAMILMLEPVFATVFTYWVLAEPLDGYAYLGMALMIGAVAIINRRIEALA